MGRWLNKHAAVVGIVFVLITSLALYLIPSNILKEGWGIVLVVVGPAVAWFTRYFEMRGRDNKVFIRQLEPLVKDAGDMEFAMRSLARDLLNKPMVQTELGSGTGIQGWSSYIDSIGAWQLSALSKLKTDLKEADPMERTQVNDIITSFYQILGRVLEFESRLTTMCQKINNLPNDSMAGWENLRQLHQILGTQLSSLKPFLIVQGRGDLFDTFINQPPATLRAP